jgi:cytoskeletal protein RodZ
MEVEIMTQIGDGSRLQKKRQKRRKGILLNVFIGIVLLAAVTVAYQAFFTSSNETAATKTEQKKEANKESSKKKEKSTDNKEAVKKKESAKNKDKTGQSAEASKPVKDEKVVLKDQQNPNVAEAYTNPSWKPIGTSQSEPHTTKFDMSSQDWKEMTKTISYALDIPEDTLTILFLGNNGPNKAIGTVQARDTKQKYKVYIEWVENQGWQPTLVQQMK